MSDPIEDFVAHQFASLLKGWIEKQVQTDLVDKGLLSAADAGTFVAGLELDGGVVAELVAKAQAARPAGSNTSS